MSFWLTLMSTRSPLLLKFMMAAVAGLVGLLWGSFSLIYDPSYEVAAAVGITVSVSLVVGTWLADYPLSLWVKGVGRIVSYQRARADKLRNRVDTAMSQMGMRVPDESTQVSPPNVLFRMCLNVSVFLTFIGIQGGLVSATWIFIEINTKFADSNLYLAYLVWSISAFVLGVGIHLVIFGDIEIAIRLQERKLDKVMKAPFSITRKVARTNVMWDAYGGGGRFLSKVLGRSIAHDASASIV